MTCELGEIGKEAVNAYWKVFLLLQNFPEETTENYEETVLLFVPAAPLPNRTPWNNWTFFSFRRVTHVLVVLELRHSEPVLFSFSGTGTQSFTDLDLCPAGGSMSWDFTASKRSVNVSNILNTQNSHSFVHSSYSLQMSLQAGLPESSGRQVRSYPQPASSSPRLSTHIHPWDEQQASDGRGSEMSVSPHHNQSINVLLFRFTYTGRRKQPLSDIRWLSSGMLHRVLS
jgi:hypothetical protein